MKTDFSIQRINLLLRKDWIENKKKLAYGVLVILGVLFFFLLSSILWDTRFRTFTLYVLGSLGTFIAFCSYVNLMIHRPRGLFLTLPASNQEKYAAILIEGIVVFLAYQVTFCRRNAWEHGEKKKEKGLLGRYAAMVGNARQGATFHI